MQCAPGRPHFRACHAFFCHAVSRAVNPPVRVRSTYCQTPALFFPPALPGTWVGRWALVQRVRCPNCPVGRLSSGKARYLGQSSPWQSTFPRPPLWDGRRLVGSAGSPFTAATPVGHDLYLRLFESCPLRARALVRIQQSPPLSCVATPPRGNRPTFFFWLFQCVV